MSEYQTGEIYIPINYVLDCEELKEKIEDYIDAVIDNELTLEDILQSEEWEGISLSISVSDGVFSLRDDDARYGSFFEIESLCREYQVPYDRETFDDGEYGSDFTVWFRPGMEKERFSYTPDGQSQLSIKEIRKVFDDHLEDEDDSVLLNSLINLLNYTDLYSDINHLKNWCQ
ncbi:hypothetical protein [Bacillus velezensis]|uniref:hypothetical protein n=1 Tax=Bacillus velezensis TaxID=492670 RepID=UPI001A929467|nr:hypothetical protein [Bacillus velezensis]BCT30448.1 hypothetical protein BVAD3_41220 [Bacillus velezensis]